jgi:hypothetical protein
MYQQEIQFFWPLTEQIPLDLDYSNCVKPTLSVAYGTGTTISSLAIGTTWTTSAFRLQENTTTMIVAKKPNLLRKLLFKLLGFKWEIK